MSHYVILARSPRSASSINAALGVLTRQSLDSSNLVNVIWTELPEHDAAGINVYRAAAAKIEAFLAQKSDAAASTSVIVDVVRLSNLNAISPGADWDNLVAMLILTFPELSWRFGAFRGPALPGAAEVAPQHRLTLSNLSSPRLPVFDPTGLRTLIRRQTNKALEESQDDLRLAIREQLAAGIDEEHAFAYWHAYCAYRFGYRADVITHLSSMRACFPNDGRPHAYSLLFEDMSLNFPDLTAKAKLVDLDERAIHFPSLDSRNPSLETSNRRILVTGGQPAVGDEVVARNERHLAHKSGAKLGKIVYKPTRGMFAFWRAARLMRRDRFRAILAMLVRNTPRKGNAPGFVWPPQPPSEWRHWVRTTWRRIRIVLAKTPWFESPPPEIRPSHGAPGKLQLLAETLLERARRLSASTKSPWTLVLGATTSSDALELIGAKTPSTALDALALKHQFELSYECEASGIEYHVGIAARLSEVRAEVGTLCQWMDDDQRGRAAANARMRIATRLVKILREAALYDEEQKCLAEIRGLHTSQWLKSLPWSKKIDAFAPFAFIARLVVLDLPIRYVELLFRSFPVFLLCVMGWIVALTFGYAWAFDEPVHWRPIAEGIGTFFSAGPPVTHSAEPAHPDRVALVNSIAIVFGSLHVGVLISYLFSMVSRR